MDMDKQEIFNYIRSLPNVDGYMPNLRARCVLCGDSKKNVNKKRLGIRIDVNNPNEPIIYHCFNCGERGILTKQMLEDLGASDNDMIRNIYQFNKSKLKSGDRGINKFKNNNCINVIIPKPTNNDNTIRKIKYLYDRIGFKIPISDFESLKIIFSLNDFIKVNDLQPTIKSTYLLDRDYIGFLSVNNEYIIFRDITDRHEFRYYKYNIFGIWDNTSSFYTIKNSIDLFTSDNIDICLAEGTFDIISILYNVYKGDIRNKVLISTCNGSFNSPINYYINKGLIGDNINLKIYQDNDTLVNFKSLKNKFSPFINNVNVYYNKLNKDFGVPVDRIDIDEILI